jgi:aryl-alcohol dehydrogenase-like predicted oxidoreductase
MVLSHAEAAAGVRDAFNASLTRLGFSKVYGLLVHNADDLLGPLGDTLWALMQSFKSEGRVEKIGCSVYDPAQFFVLQQRYALDLVQLPYNIYDQRYVTSGMAAIAKSSGVEVHVRSAFLQGILLGEPGKLPLHFAGVRAHHEALWAQYEALGLSPLQAALGFCLARPDIDKVLVGCERPAQLDGILQAAAVLVTSESLKRLGQFAVNDEAIINPSRWV